MPRAQILMARYFYWETSASDVRVFTVMLNLGKIGSYECLKGSGISKIFAQIRETSSVVD